MAYTNSVGIMPGAASEKLPFVHSDFKPRSKFAKCFGGFKRYTKQDNSVLRDYNDGKLPLLHYSVDNQRNLIALGSKSRNGRPEYPGFAGKKKILKKKDQNSTNVHPAISGSFTRNQANSMKRYLSLPNVHQREITHAVHNMTESEYYWQRQLLKDLGSEGQRASVRHKNMDSLFIVDDDDDDDEVPQPHNDTMVVGNSVRFQDANLQESFHRCSPVGNRNNHSDDLLPVELQMNPFAQGVNKKLREDRGKSGMKRDRRREPDHMRMLGDVMTAERMHELLLPKKSEGPLMSLE